MPYSNTTVVIPLATVARKPELRMLGEKGIPKCELLVVVDRGHGRDASRDWFGLTAWGVNAENLARWLDKGSKVSVTGHLRGDFYPAKDGKSRLGMEVVADQVQFLSRPRTAGSGQSAEPPPGQGRRSAA